MTLRRLNIRIQGFPESYATEPYMTAEATLAVSEPALHRPIAASSVTDLPPDMPIKSMRYGPEPEEHVMSSSVDVCMPVIEETEVRDTGVGDDPIYGEDEKEAAM